MSRVKEIIDKYEKVLPIDIYDLARQCAEQAVYYEEIGMILSEERRREKINKLELKILKEELKTLAATIELNVRNDTSRYPFPLDKNGNPKVTESTIEAIVSTDSDILAKQNLIMEKEKICIEIEKEVESLQILLDAFVERLTMLKYEVELYTTEYYANASTLGSLKGAKDVREGVRRKIIEKRGEAT